MTSMARNVKFGLAIVVLVIGAVLIVGWSDKVLGYFADEYDEFVCLPRARSESDSNDANKPWNDPNYEGSLTGLKRYKRQMRAVWGSEDN